ncbi:uncharacterized protein si:ch73-303b9.1 [Trematomus bernacchii]|uniref:uncharacterized protein si:ch73-303b9.1 n=1 Tax=Trematomus bernacchii TaxID=40690 RepID=UPI0014699E7F|nr:uncharacterized protein si:ch73-303b9.1 [Trematomus bernacchii]
MEEASVIKDMKSFECPSPLELDREFLGEQSGLSALSLDLPTSRASNDTLADGSDPRLSILASLCLSSDPISPSLAPTNAQESDRCYLAVPLQGKSSTPYELLLKKKQPAVLDQSYSDLTVSRMSWDVSGITSEINSPRPFMESSALEATWSPKPQMQHSGADVSP